jgi:predicted extracellular nuclease
MRRNTFAAPWVAASCADAQGPMVSHASSLRRVIHLLLVLFISSTAHVLVAMPSSAAGPIVISQVYGGGGNAGATLKQDFIELFNRGAHPVSLAGWSVQYASATGSAWQKTDLVGTLQPGQYLLIQQSQGPGGSVNLPTPDVTGTIAMAANHGKIALVSDRTLITSGTVCPAGVHIVDVVGYGSANCFEGAGATAPLTNTTAALRAAHGCTDSDHNGADFAPGTPTPRSSAAPLHVCAGPSQPVITMCPATVGAVAGASTSVVLTASDADGIVTAAVMTSPPLTDISLGAVIPAATAGGTASVPLTVAGTVPVGHYTVMVRFRNNDAAPQFATCTVAVTVGVPAASTRIHDIQGRSHLSPLNGQTVAQVPGIVTATRSNGFYLQDPSPDTDPATSEGIFVFTSATPSVTMGDAVTVSGTVAEFRPGGAAGVTNLTITEIINPSVHLMSSGHPLPAPVIIGTGGRIPPPKVIEDDATGNAETSGIFEPTTDGLDFYESLEGMRVQLTNAVAVGPTSSVGEIPVLGDHGAHATLRTARGGIVIAPDDFNPERVVLDDTIVGSAPQVHVGDWFPTVMGVMDYSRGNYKVLVTAALSPVSGALQPEHTAVQSANQLAVASFNVENLSPADPPAKFQVLAAQIVQNLQAPDIIGVMEMQDNSGPVNDAVVQADVTFSTLIAAIQAVGGPAYHFRQIDPVDGQDGGQPGGNIRVGFLFNAVRVTFIDRPGGTSTSPTTVMTDATGPQLSASPGRIDPMHPAFTDSRKPLAAEYLFNGRRLFVIANHFNSKGGDDPLFGVNQPPVRSSEGQRAQQAAVVRDFVHRILAIDAHASVVVLGDLNDFEFSTTLSILKSAGLNDLVETLAPQERYTYVFEGNAQVLDHILVSHSLMSAVEYDVVHVNAEFATQASDHDPEVARLFIPAP